MYLFIDFLENCQPLCVFTDTNNVVDNVYNNQSSVKVSKYFRSLIEGYTRILIFRKFSILPVVILNLPVSLHKPIFFLPTPVIRAYLPAYKI